MCGIVAAIDTQHFFSNESLRHLRQALITMHYRGPDGTGSRTFNSLHPTSKNQESNIFLGHNRLSIIDLSEKGLQPFTTDNEIFLSFNGEIYNYIELRSDLRKKGIEFKTNTDTEVLLNLYKQSGTSRFGELNGMWAFALYDARQQKFIVSRDRFGVKPLYYLQKGSAYYFASEIKVLLPLLPSKNINMPILGHYLHNSTLDQNPNETFFNGIKKLPPKHSLILDLVTGSEKLEQYWDFSPEDLSNYSNNDLVEQFRVLFTDAVRIRLRSDVKIGNTLSGGLDSSSIAVMANQLIPGGLQNYSIISSNKKLSEERFLDVLQDEAGVQIQKIPFTGEVSLPIIEQVVWHHDEPLLSLSAVAHFQMMQLFKQQTDITVILSGQGGDEGLAGYNKYFFFQLKELLRQRKFSPLLNESFNVLPKILTEFQWQHAQRYVGFSPKNLIDNVVLLPKERLGLTDFSDFRQRQIQDINHFSVPALTHYEDRTSMAHSLEIRLPFLDYRLLNFNLNLPLNLKIRNGYSKYILRRSLYELPHAIAWRNDKKGFSIEEDKLLSPQNLPAIQALFQNSALVTLGVLDKQRFKIALQGFCSGKSNYWARDLHRIIFAEIWAKKFLF